MKKFGIFPALILFTGWEFLKEEVDTDVVKDNICKVDQNFSKVVAFAVRKESLLPSEHLKRYKKPIPIINLLQRFDDSTCK